MFNPISFYKILKDYPSKNDSDKKNCVFKFQLKKMLEYIRIYLLYKVALWIIFLFFFCIVKLLLNAFKRFPNKKR